MRGVTQTGVAALRIDRIETWRTFVPPRRDYRWLGLQVSLGGWLVVRVTTEDGATGWGEATALPDWGGDFARQYGETPQTGAHLINDFLAPALRGVDAG